MEGAGQAVGAPAGRVSTRPGMATAARRPGGRAGPSWRRRWHRGPWPRGPARRRSRRCRRRRGCRRAARRPWRERLARPELHGHAVERVDLVDRPAGTSSTRLRARSTGTALRSRSTGSKLLGRLARDRPGRARGTSTVSHGRSAAMGGGGSVRQRSSASGQRSANTQPGSSAPGGGRKPGMESSRP